MNLKSISILIVCIALISTSLFVFWLNNNNDSQREMALEYLPEKIETTGLNPELVRRIQLAENGIRIGKSPIHDLAELSRFYHANGFLDQAITCYEGLIIIDPQNSKWRHFLATILANYGYADDSIQLWQEVIKMDSHYMPARIRLGDVYLKNNQINKAFDIYETCLKRDSGNPYARVGLARIAISRNMLTRAKTHLESASKYSKGKIGKDLLVSVYEKLGEDYKAFALRGEAKAKGSFVEVPDPWLLDIMEDCYNTAQLMNIAGYKSFSGETLEARKWNLKLLKLDPENALAHFQIALVYRELRNNKLAIKHFRKAVNFKPDLSDAWIQLSALYKKLGNTAEAELVFYQGLKNCPESPAFYIEYARRLLEEERYDNAIKNLKKSIALRPNEALAYLELSRVYFLLNRVDDAILQMEKALDVEAGNLTAMTTLCFHYISSENKDKAEYWLKEVQKHPRIDPPTLSRLKKLYADKF